MKIEKRTFIVSGGSAGLGLATVHQLLESNAFVAILDRDPPAAEISSSERERVKYFNVDITQLTDIEKAVEGAVEWTKTSNAPLGGVVNCAGIATAAKIIDFRNEPHSEDLWDFAIAVNLTGTFNLTRIVLKHLIHVQPEKDGERGVVILVSSSAAFEGQPGQVAYSATKGAIHSMTLPLARDLGRHGIRVMTIAPGVFASSMTDRMPEKTRRSLENDLIFPKRLGLGTEFAQTVKWILECAYANGETIRLSGAGRLPGKL